MRIVLLYFPKKWTAFVLSMNRPLLPVNELGRIDYRALRVSWRLRLFLLRCRDRRGEPCGSGESPGTLPAAVSKRTLRTASVVSAAIPWPGPPLNSVSLPFSSGLTHAVLSRPNRAAERQCRRGNFFGRNYLGSCLCGGVASHSHSRLVSLAVCPGQKQRKKTTVIKKPKLNFVCVCYCM